MPETDRSPDLLDEAFEWIVLLHSGHASETDRAQAVEWQARSPGHRRAYARAERLWLELGQVADVEGPERRRGRRAGLIVTLLLCAIAYSQLGRLTDLWQSDYRTATGEQRTLRLPDGSTVLLDTDTAVALDFDAAGRRVRLLHGQALFTVAADRARAFEVEAGGARIRALGTVFEVAAYDEAVSVTVQEHAVRVELAEPGGAVTTVRAGERVRTGPDRGMSAPEPVDLGESSAWQRGRWVFKGRPLAEVVADLNRYRHGHVLIYDQPLKALRVTGVFPLADPDAVLQSLQQILGIRALRFGPWLTVLRS